MTTLQDPQGPPIPGAKIEPTFDSGLFRLMALAAGLSATALYFAQPLLHRLSTEFGMSAAQSSWLVTGAQAGYAVGLLLLVPLGDILRRGRFAVTLLLSTAALLVVATASVGGSMLVMATVAASMAAVGAQVLVPMAAGIAPEGSSGRAVGIVMSGVLSGGMLGRAASGVLADIAGWRSGYWVAAALLVVTALTLRRRLPADGAPSTRLTLGRYLRLLRSLITPLQQLPVLRRRTLVAALAMAAFTIQLSAVTLRLSVDPFGWSTTAIGIFSLLALVGIALMPLTGRIADAGHTRIVITVGLTFELGAWMLMLVAGSTVIGLAAGVVGLIVGQQAVMVATQAVVYALRPEARSRMNAILMASCFAAGAAGSALAAAAWSIAGWTGACVVAAILALLGLTTQLAARGR
ncbi:MFS transporter [Rhodococcus sp. NPDC058521]|uniref:MFS transporter n=1 Tax=Rhodococcus sp. NPDC058521 TaxID=3346536 RepID=UPI003649D896